MLIDAAAYYVALQQAFRQARARIMILGWDFDPRTRLDPADPATDLRRLLPALVERRSDLHVHLLIWDVSLVYGPSRTLDQMFDDWQAHPRIHFHLDGRHPFGAAHHEKIVCVDDALAFCGGIDLTVRRWDTPEHAPFDPRRADAHEGPYGPVHDLQMAVGGEAARAVAELARGRWADAVGESLEPCGAGNDPWPSALPAWLTDVTVGIARTRAATGDAPGVHEVAALNAAALAAARRSVYIEAQYLAARPVADRLVELLERPDGPEIVILVWRQATGWIERLAMGSNRDRLLRRLAAADRGGRLRAYWLAAADEPECEINLHAKLIVIDDVFVRVGSSNFNNRSRGFDSECDLAIEAAGPATRSAIARLRSTLLAEHLARTPEEVGRAVAAHGLIGAIERLNPGNGRLRAYRLDPDAGPASPVPGTALVDPAEPLSLDHLRRMLARAVLPD